MCKKLLPIRLLDLQRVCTCTGHERCRRKTGTTNRRNGPNVNAAPIVLSASGGMGIQANRKKSADKLFIINYDKLSRN